MPLKASLHKRTFEFSFNARTSRGVMKEKISWFVKIRDEATPEVAGLGECGPLPGLSPELNAEFEGRLHELVDAINARNINPPTFSNLRELNAVVENLIGNEKMHGYSSVVFALETALLDWINGGERIIFRNQFLKGQAIPINGLIWMGGLDFMLQQIEIKIREGFTCLKLKIGSHDFEKECDVLQYIRRKYFRDKITIRLDANGAFKKEDALTKLKALARFDIHSIEQPIKPGQPELAELCKTSPIPIALDEELIGVHSLATKQELLTRIQPRYVVLKPTLHGGLHACDEWIQAAEKLNIGWWITSALESNLGLNAISQFAACYPIHVQQGLGTGMIYTNNIESPLLVDKGMLRSEGFFFAEIE